jgi:hypothetical protein
MGNQHDYRCPQCKSQDDLVISATVEVEARLSDDGTDNEGGDTTWEEKSPARCSDCGWKGVVADLSPKPKGKKAKKVPTWDRLSEKKQNAFGVSISAAVGAMGDLIEHESILKKITGVESKELDSTLAEYFKSDKPVYEADAQRVYQALTHT